MESDSTTKELALYRRAGEAVALSLRLRDETRALLASSRMIAADSRTCRAHSSVAVSVSRAMRRMRQA